MTFQNRVAVITGTAGMIGKDISREFGKPGIAVVMADVNKAELRETDAAFSVPAAAVSADIF